MAPHTSSRTALIPLLPPHRYEEFDAELGRRFAELAAAHDGSVLKGVVLPQIKRHVALTLLAARERLENAGDYYRPFHLFGYDFLVDANLRIWLCAISLDLPVPR